MRRNTLTARRLGAIVLAVLAVHALLLRGVGDTLPALDHFVPKRPFSGVQVRTVAPAVPTLAATPEAAPVAPAAPSAWRGARGAPAEPRRPPVPRGDAHALAEVAAAPPAPPPALPAVAVPPQPAAVVVGVAVTEAPASPSSGDLPIYRTRMPPAFVFGYDLRRGTSTGNGELRWLPQGERYQASLAATSGGAALLAWESVGSFDAAGLAPARHTERRRGRSTQAANFRRDEGKVIFSGPSIEHVLPPGAQDRLSWMLQLAAIAAADPSLVGPSGRVSFLVVGARGDADVWSFIHVGEEALDLAAGSTPTLRLVREPIRTYDTRAEVWLDPKRHYLPVRATLSSGSEGDSLQLVFREVLPAP